MKPAFDDLLDSIYALNVNQSLKDNLVNKVKIAKQTRLLNKCTLEVSSYPLKVPDTIRKYDLTTCLVGGSAHPAIVYKVSDKLVIVDGVEKTIKQVYVICFTSNKDYLGNVAEVVKSRFLTNSYITASFQVVTEEEAKQHFKGVYDERAEANMFFRKVKQYYIDLFNIKEVKKK